MYISRQLTLFAALLFFAATFVGCASSVQINSEPPGASVMVDGQHLGETPVTYTGTDIAFTSRQIVLEKEGYETTRTQLTRDGNINAGALIGGIFCMWPFFLWVMDYPSNVTYNMREEARAGDDVDEDTLMFVLKPKQETTTSEVMPVGLGNTMNNSNCYVCDESN